MYEGKREEWSERLVRATAALYRVTDLVPAGEPLRTALREYANEVLVGCIREMHDGTHSSTGPEGAIETLLGFLAVAETLPEVRPENFLVLEREYRAFLATRAQEAKTRAGEVQRVQRGEDADVSRAINPAPSRGVLDPAGKISLLHSSPRQAAGYSGRGGIKKERSARRVSTASVRSNAAHERQQAILKLLAKTPQAKVSDFYEILRGVSPKTIQRDLQDLVARNTVQKEGEKRWTVYTLAGNTAISNGH